MYNIVVKVLIPFTSSSLAEFYLLDSQNFNSKIKFLDFRSNIIVSTKSENFFHVIIICISATY